MKLNTVKNEAGVAPFQVGVNVVSGLGSLLWPALEI